jgi:hypothetical protein
VEDSTLCVVKMVEWLDTEGDAERQSQAAEKD